MKTIKVTLADYYNEEHIKAMTTLVNYLNHVEILEKDTYHFLLKTTDEIAGMFEHLSLCDCCYVEEV